MSSLSKVTVSFMTLSGAFATAKKESFESEAAALAAVRAYAEAAGFSNVKTVDDPDDPCGYRITARTPGGRGGRNVAFVDPGSDYGDFG